MSDFGGGNNVEEDPAAEFLAREQADLAGIVDDVAAPPPIAQQNGNGVLSGLPVSGGVDSNGFIGSAPAGAATREEPEKIRMWREEQKTILEKKDAEEEIRKEELRQQAKKELVEWYARYHEQIEKTKQENRNAEKDYVSQKSQKGSEWEEIAKLCDFNPKSSRHTKDVTRMKSLLLQLKQNPPVKKKL